MHTLRFSASMALLVVGVTLAACGGAHGSSARQTLPHRPLVIVPSVRGASVARGEKLVRTAGLVWSPMYAGSAGAPEIVTNDQIVLSQGPAAGKRVAKGTPVAVAIGVRPSTIAKVRRSRGH